MHSNYITTKCLANTPLKKLTSNADSLSLIWRSCIKQPQTVKHRPKIHHKISQTSETSTSESTIFHYLFQHSFSLFLTAQSTIVLSSPCRLSGNLIGPHFIPRILQRKFLRGCTIVLSNCLVGGFNHLENYESQWGSDYPIYHGKS